MATGPDHAHRYPPRPWKVTIVGGRTIATFAYEDHARARARDEAARRGHPTWLHRAGPQADRLITGGPPAGTDYTEFPPSGSG